jgi:micrococcal nuclease
VAIVAVLGACDGSGASNDSPRRGDASVVRVVDGDTVRVRIAGQPDDEAVRLIGIDTPETHGAGGLRECFGKEATERLRELLPEDTPVRVVRDVEARDRYGRLLAYLYRRRDDMFVNLVMAKEGFAAPLTIAPNVAHSSEFVAAAAEARRRSRGLWARCGGADTPLGSSP